MRGKSYDSDGLVKVIGVCRDVPNNEDTWSDEFCGSRYGYKEWGNMGCFGNPIIFCSTSVIFFIL